MDAARADAGDRAVEADEALRLRQAIEEERQRNLRLLADFDNFRRRVGREKEAARGDARRAALLPLLPVLALFSVAYLAFGVPVIVAGQLVPHAGLLSTVIGYGRRC